MASNEISLQSIDVKSYTNTIAGSVTRNDSADVKLSEAITNNTNAGTSTKESESGRTATNAAAVTELESKYKSSSGGRLVSFEYGTGDDDKARRAKFIFKNSDGLEKLKAAVSDETMKAVISALEATNGFTNFMLLSLTENHQEKQQLIPTINDSFVLTYSGREPQMVTITGILPFDAQKQPASWFINFLNAYKLLFRASVLAKYKIQLQLMLPDMATYTCYPTAFYATVQSTQDHLIQFQLTATVVEETIAKATNVSSNATSVKTTADQVQKDTASQLAKQQDTSTKTDPKDVGKQSGNKNWLDSTTEFINTCITSQGNNAIAKGINQATKAISIASSLKNICSGGFPSYGSR